MLQVNPTLFQQNARKHFSNITYNVNGREIMLTNVEIMFTNVENMLANVETNAIINIKCRKTWKYSKRGISRYFTWKTL